MKTNKINLFALMACVFTLSLTSCSKDDNMEVEQEYQAKVMVGDGESKELISVSTTDNTEGSISRTGNVYSLRNFRQGTLNSEGTAVETAASVFYFDFKENDGASEENFQISLDGVGRSLSIIANEGYELSYIDKAFGLVTATDEFIATTDNTFGLQFGAAIGWANYDITIHIVSAVEDRTLVLSQNGEARFKFRVNSIYSDETPNAAAAATNFPYYSIDYQEFK